MNRTNKTPGKKRGAIIVEHATGSSVVDLRAWVSDYVRAVATYSAPATLDIHADIQPVHHLPKAS